MKQLILRKRNLLFLLIPLGIFCTQWAKSNAAVAEKVFATGIYKVLSQAIAVLTGWIPFSLMELLIVAGPITILVLIVRQRQHFLSLMTLLQNLLCLVAVIFFGYVLLCGVNYYRHPVAYHMGLTVENSTQEELTGLYTELADRATNLREGLTTVNEKGVYELPYSKRQLGKEAKKAYQALAKEYPVFGGLYPAPKQVTFSRLMSYTEITGVFTPWTMEANVNVDIPPYSIGSTMCHELAHLRGFMREDEANYIAYRACMASDSPDLQYSGTMLALIHTGNALYRQNADKYFEIYKEHISAAVSTDLIANNEYWKQFEKPVVGNTTVGEIAEKVNDTYLKVNNQTDGTQSYGRVVDYLLAEYKQNHAAVK